MKWEYWIEHDNGVKGQHGFSDYIVTDEEIHNIMKSMQNNGITIYDYGRSFAPVEE